MARTRPAGWKSRHNNAATEQQHTRARAGAARLAGRAALPSHHRGRAGQRLGPARHPRMLRPCGRCSSSKRTLTAPVFNRGRCPAGQAAIDTILPIHSHRQLSVGRGLVRAADLPIHTVRSLRAAAAALELLEGRSVPLLVEKQQRLTPSHEVRGEREPCKAIRAGLPASHPADRHTRNMLIDRACCANRPRAR